MKIVAIIEARMTSTRLPGKVLMPLGDIPMLQVLVERIRHSKHLSGIMVATTKNETDTPIVELCDRLGIRSYRGSEADVLGRVLEAAKSCDADVICELMGDSPFLDPELIDQTIETHLKSANDYTSNFYPENRLPMGFAVQVYPTTVLAKTAEYTNDPIDRAHVTYFIYQHPELFLCGGVAIDASIEKPGVRLCVDEENDYQLVRRVYDGLVSNKITASCKEILDYLQKNPDLLKLNKNVQQKQASQG